jgi:hypothetical protein
MVERLIVEDSLVRAKESMKARGVDEGVDPK